MRCFAFSSVPVGPRTAPMLFLAALWLVFRSSSLLAESVVIGVIGDFGSAAEGATSASNELAVANLVKRWNPDLILTLGDNNYPSGAASTIDVNIGQFYHEFIHPYLGVYGSGATSNRFFPCLGNHDWVQNGKPSLDYFALPGNERYYRYRTGPAEFFVLNSNADADGTTPTSTQGIWLRSALTNSTARWKLVYFHHPPYSADAGGAGNSYMRWPFAAWGATLVMAGHDHVYARIQTNGITYFINGLGGDEIHPKGNSGAGVVSHYSSDFGAMRLAVTESNLVSHFISRNDVIVDAFLLGSPLANPYLIATPMSQLLLAGRNARFSVLATGTAPLRYQWLSNSIPLSRATNSTLTINNVQPIHEAEYAVVVSSGTASNQTAPARLTLLRHPLITQQPLSVSTTGETTVTFQVKAEGAGQLRYQWRFGDMDIPGATAANLVLTNITLASAGHYAVLVTDNLGSILSDTAILTVMIRPLVTQNPVGQSAAVGQTVVWSVIAEGTLPMNYSWRRNNRVLTNIMLHSSTCFLAMPNIQLTNAGNYQVGITNIAGIAHGGLTSSAFLIVLEDHDGDRLPDEWETEFGFNPENPADASLDSDGDGASNLEEHQAGTDPLSAQSHLVIEQFRPLGDDGWELEFRALSNRTYRVEYRNSADAGPWGTLADFPASATNRSITLLDTVTMGRRFYRLVTPWLP